MRALKAIGAPSAWASPRMRSPGLAGSISSATLSATCATRPRIVDRGIEIRPPSACISKRSAWPGSSRLVPFILAAARMTREAGRLTHSKRSADRFRRNPRPYRPLRGSADTVGVPTFAVDSRATCRRARASEVARREAPPRLRTSASSARLAGSLPNGATPLPKIARLPSLPR